MFCDEDSEENEGGERSILPKICWVIQTSSSNCKGGRGLKEEVKTKTFSQIKVQISFHSLPLSFHPSEQPKYSKYINLSWKIIIKF